jgi:hypothetical protein
VLYPRSGILPHGVQICVVGLHSMFQTSFRTGNMCFKAGRENQNADGAWWEEVCACFPRRGLCRCVIDGWTEDSRHHCGHRSPVLGRLLGAARRLRRNLGSLLGHCTLHGLPRSGQPHVQPACLGRDGQDQVRRMIQCFDSLRVW